MISFDGAHSRIVSVVSASASLLVWLIKVLIDAWALCLAHICGGIRHTLSHEDRLVGSVLVICCRLNSFELRGLRSSFRIPAALIGVCGFTLASNISDGSSTSLTLWLLEFLLATHHVVVKLGTLTVTCCSCAWLLWGLLSQGFRVVLWLKSWTARIWADHTDNTYNAVIIQIILHVAIANFLNRAWTH